MESFYIHSKIFIWGSRENKNIKGEEITKAENYLDIDLVREINKQKRKIKYFKQVWLMARLKKCLH